MAATATKSNTTHVQTESEPCANHASQEKRPVCVLQTRGSAQEPLCGHLEHHWSGEPVDAHDGNVFEKQVHGLVRSRAEFPLVFKLPF